MIYPNYLIDALKNGKNLENVSRVTLKRGSSGFFMAHNSRVRIMQIEDYEFEEEKTLTNLATLLEDIARQLRENETLELPMPSLKTGTITLPIGEPVETEIEVGIRKHFIHVVLDLSWRKPEEGGVSSSE